MRRSRRKISLVNIIRRGVQLISFLLFPGLFISVFSAIKSVYTAVAQGTFNLGTLFPQLLILFAVIPVTIFFGRFFCGFICSFGSMGDFLWFISRKLRKRPVRINEKADRVLKSFKYLFFIFILVFLWTLGTVSFDNSYNPWNIFGMYATLSGWPSTSGLLTVGAVLLLVIFVGSFFIERFFCRYVCPLGAGFAVLSKLRFLKIRKPSENCGNCRLCTINCPAGISMYKYDKISSGECINCFKCVSVCPRNNVKAVIGGQDIAPLTAGVTAAAAIIGLYYVGRIASDNIAYAAPQTAIADTVSAGNSVSGQYTNGTYTGSASGFKGTTTVQVKVDNGYIADISIVSTGDDPDFMSSAKSGVISEILKSQSTEVDAVTGATYSSNAIINAVADALGISGTAAAEKSSPSASLSPSPSKTEAAPKSSSTISYKDGTYSGTGTGFRGNTKVSVKVSGGKITDIEIISYSDDREFFERASSTVINEIINSQSVNVKAVSGATFSSNGIMEAAADALNIGFANPNGSSQSGRHGGRGGLRG